VDASGRLFEPPPRFAGLPEEGFKVFDLPDRETRRRAILAAFHPPLQVLAEDLLERLNPLAEAPLHAHLPRLDWPPGYEPFCTWLALSREAHGYQAGPQLNLGVHRDYTAARLAWDTSAAGFGRFEFFCRHGGLGESLAAAARENGLAFRVYASAPWPEGSRRVFESDANWVGAFEEVKRRGVWFELGRRWDLPGETPRITSPELGRDAAAVFEVLLPLYDRIAGHAAGAKEGRE
jgi:hypothetical protein